MSLTTARALFLLLSLTVLMGFSANRGLLSSPEKTPLQSVEKALADRSTLIDDVTPADAKVTGSALVALTATQRHQLSGVGDRMLDTSTGTLYQLSGQSWALVARLPSAEGPSGGGNDPREGDRKP